MFSSEVISTFNDLDYNIYNYILNNGEQVIYMRIRDLATAIHVSTSTILRFCRKVGCDGFSEFKVKLKLYLESESEESVKGMKEFAYEFMERTLKGNLDEVITEAAHEVVRANHVLFVGFGSSGILAQYGARYFSSLGKFSIAINDPYFPINAQQLDNSITIALSVSGESPQTVDQVTRLKEEGSKIISITNTKSSTLAHLSHIVIPYYATEERREIANLPLNITTQLPVMYILEATAREVYKLT